MAFSQNFSQNSNPLVEAENNKNIIVRDVAGFFGRQDSTSADQLLFGGMETKKNEKGPSSPESDGEYNGMDIMDKHEKNYMSPIVSLNIPDVLGNVYMLF